jgi:hypothetical protein
VSEPVALSPFGVGCPCVVTHSPSGYVLVVHHILPRSWGGPDVPSNRQEVCSNTHDATHRLLDDYVRYHRAGLGEPPWEHRRRFNPLARAMAAAGWEQRPATPTFTLPAYRPPEHSPT